MTGKELHSCSHDEPWKYKRLKSQSSCWRHSTFHFKCQFLHLVISVVFHTFLKIKTWNKKYTLKNEPIYLFCKFQGNPPIFTKLNWRLFFVLIIFHSKLNLNMSGFCGSVRLCGCCDEWVNMQTVGEERNTYRLSLLWLVRYGTRGKCARY